LANYLWREADAMHIEDTIELQIAGFLLLTVIALWLTS
jgi:hypothetical protein